MEPFEPPPPGQSGLEKLRALIASGQRPPINQTLDFALVEVEPGRAVIEATPAAHAYSFLGMVRGGYTATLLDSACGCAVHLQLGAGD